MSHYPFHRLQGELLKLIKESPAESRLPSEPDLARKLRVSRATLREAMRSFETQGLIRRRQGVGTFVIGEVPLIESGLEMLESIETLASRIGMKVSTGSLAMEQIQANEEISNLMKIEKGSNLLQISRVILTDGRPVAYLVDILAENTLTKEEIDSGFKGSVLDLLLKRGKPRLSSSRTEIKAVGASPEVAHLLEIQRGDVLLYFIANLITNAGKVIDHSQSYFLPGFFNFHVNRRVG